MMGVCISQLKQNQEAVKLQNIAKALRPTSVIPKDGEKVYETILKMTKTLWNGLARMFLFVTTHTHKHILIKILLLQSVNKISSSCLIV
jgi:hypothetical protein